MIDNIISDAVSFEPDDKVRVIADNRVGFIIRWNFRPNTPDNDVRKVYCVGFDSHWSLEHEFFHADDLIKV